MPDKISFFTPVVRVSLAWCAFAVVGILALAGMVAASAPKVFLLATIGVLVAIGITGVVVGENYLERHRG